MSPKTPDADSSANSSASYASVFNKATAAIKLYDDLVDKISDWDEFAKVIDGLVKSGSEDLDEGLKCIKNASVLWMCSHDEIIKAVRTVYDWCAYSAKVLPVFLRCTTGGESTDSLKMFRAILHEGKTKLERALSHLDNSTTKLNEALGEMGTLGTTYEDRIRRMGTDTKNAVARRRAQAYTGAVVGAAPAFFVPVAGQLLSVGVLIGGLVVSYSVAAGIVEGAQVPAFWRTLEEKEKHFTELLKTIEDTKSAIESVKKRSRTEIGDIKKVETDVDASQWVDSNVKCRHHEEVRLRAEELLETCKDYMKKKNWTKVV